MRRRCLKNIESLAVFFIIFGCFTIYPLSAIASTFPLVKIEDQQLSVSAQNASLEDILRQFSDQSRVAIEFYGSPQRSISIEFSNVPIEDGLKRVLARSNVSFQYRREVDAGGRADFILDKVLVVTNDAGDGLHRFEPAPLPESPPPAPAPEPPPAATSMAMSPAPTAVTASDETPRVGNGVFIKADPTHLTNVSTDTIHAAFSGVTTPLTMRRTGDSPAEGGEATAPMGQGVSVNSISPSGLMAQLGVQEGDVIQDINGTQTATPDQVAEALQRGLSEEGGGMLRIEVERGDTVEPIYVDISPSQQ